MLVGTCARFLTHRHSWLTDILVYLSRVLFTAHRGLFGGRAAAAEQQQWRRAGALVVRSALYGIELDCTVGCMALSWIALSGVLHALHHTALHVAAPCDTDPRRRAVLY